MFLFMGFPKGQAIVIFIIELAFLVIDEIFLGVGGLSNSIIWPNLSFSLSILFLCFLSFLVLVLA
jgi:hypothetical protein